ncbi:MAG: hypothetical protein PHY29_03055 [Syntrophales bacterium]|nr:hypothetical protein [Syntrophales bacterium]
MATVATSFNYGYGRTYYWATVNAVTSSGNTEVVAAVTGKRIKVVSYELSSNDDVQIKFQSATNDIHGSTLWSSTLNWGTRTDFTSEGGYVVVRMQTNEAEALNINLSGAAATGVNVSVLYYSE